ncbi:MAG: D-glycero-beta-D-manno-heptose 1-phosphate adenylyltransferase [Candidatus Omnitrophica bacterium CG11_big_fil_rev_8_21_14_0_20_63_9]|nr:MAG: D-glycero-beta-D-manno-heptose 1-phosphate adenylyltransferase [Candidatus Omnitrophica bacterium CG11_big_fil_rev_8_21_14_0_20_63_9]
MRSSAPPRADTKIKSAAALIPLLRKAQRRGRRVVFTNGCFDLLHAGHVTLLERSRRLGNLLVVGINSDHSVRAIKGPSRPIVAQRQRALVLAGLASVDFVTVFDAPTPQRLIQQLRPDVLVKGADWGAGQIVGREMVERFGGRVVRVPLVKGLSTSQLVERIRSL